MPNEQLKFWITCPDCRKPFGVDPRFVLQYLNRVIDAKINVDARNEETKRGGERWSEAASDAPGERGNPTTRKAPYRNERRGGSGRPTYR